MNQKQQDVADWTLHLTDTGDGKGRVEWKDDRHPTKEEPVRRGHILEITWDAAPGVELYKNKTMHLHLAVYQLYPEGKGSPFRNDELVYDKEPEEISDMEFSNILKHGISSSKRKEGPLGKPHRGLFKDVGYASKQFVETGTNIAFTRINTWRLKFEPKKGLLTMGGKCQLTIFWEYGDPVKNQRPQSIYVMGT